MKDNVCLQEILNACIGVDEESHPNGGSVFQLGTYHKNRNEINIDTQRNIVAPYYNLIITDAQMIVEIYYRNPFDLEFRSLFSLLEKYGKDMENFFRKKNDNARPYFKMMLVPLKYEGRFVVELISPSYWSLQPDNDGNYNKIVIFFNAKNYRFLETEGYDYDEIVKQLQRDQETIAMYEAREAQKQMDAEDEDGYEKRMERAREELRKDKSQW